MSGSERSTRERHAKRSFADGVPKPEFGNEDKTEFGIEVWMYQRRIPNDFNITINQIAPIIAAIPQPAAPMRGFSRL